MTPMAAARRPRASSSLSSSTSSNNTQTSFGNKLASFFPSFPPLRRASSRSLKFEVTLTIHGLLHYPQSGRLFVKWKDGQGSYGLTKAVNVSTRDYTVRWEIPFTFLASFRVDNESNILLPRMLHFSVRQTHRRTGAIKRVGILDINMSEYLAAGRKTDLCLLQESRFNASLHFTLASRQLMGDPLYRCPLAAKQVEEDPPELRPSSSELLRSSWGRDGNSLLSSSSSSGGGGREGGRVLRVAPRAGTGADNPSSPSSSSSYSSSSPSPSHHHDRLYARSVSLPLAARPPSLLSLDGRERRADTFNYSSYKRETAGECRQRDSMEEWKGKGREEEKEKEEEGERIGEEEIET
ncbi:hypothetical protein VYU27_005659 [Nannochloropsis oceanica]